MRREVDGAQSFGIPDPAECDLYGRLMFAEPFTHTLNLFDHIDRRGHKSRALSRFLSGV